MSDAYKLFISYAHEDRAHFERLKTFLNPYLHTGELEIWDDRELTAGQDWDAEIKERVETCDAFIALVSADFQGSDYVQGVELKRALELFGDARIDIIPIIVGWAPVDGTWLERLQNAVGGRTPVPLRKEPDKGWAEAVAEIRKKAQEFDPARRAGGGFKVTMGKVEPIRGGFVGRVRERRDLTDWLDGRGTFGQSNVLTLRALGGYGKSALAWVWTEGEGGTKAAELKFEGVLWWSFYDPGDTADQFASYALNALGEKVGKGAPLHAKLQTLALLSGRKRYLFVMDGAERLLRQYRKGELSEDEVKDGEISRPLGCLQSEMDEFFEKLALQSHRSRWLITSRATPAALQDVYGAGELEVVGLNQEETRELFAQQGVDGSDRAFAKLEQLYGGHGLTLSVLARRMATRRIATLDGVDAEALLQSAGDEDQRRLSVLRGAVEDLSPAARDVLVSLTLSEKPSDMARLRRLNAHLEPAALEAAMDALRDFGLAEFTGASLRFDLHPVVRRVGGAFAGDDHYDRAEEALGGGDVFLALGDAPKALAEAQNEIDLVKLDLSRRRFEPAWARYSNRLRNLFLSEGSLNRCADLLLNFLDESGAPRISEVDERILLLTDLAAALSRAGRIREAADFPALLVALAEQTDRTLEISEALAWAAMLSLARGDLAAARAALAAPARAKLTGAERATLLQQDVSFDVRCAVAGKTYKSNSGYG